MECRGEIHAILAAQCLDTNMDIMKIVEMRDTWPPVKLVNRHLSSRYRLYNHTLKQSFMQVLPHWLSRQCLFIFKQETWLQCQCVWLYLSEKTLKRQPTRTRRSVHLSPSYPASLPTGFSDWTETRTDWKFFFKKGYKPRQGQAKPYSHPLGSKLCSVWGN